MPDVRPSVLRFNFLENICVAKNIPHTLCVEKLMILRLCGMQSQLRVSTHIKVLCVELQKDEYLRLLPASTV